MDAGRVSRIPLLLYSIMQFIVRYVLPARDKKITDIWNYFQKILLIIVFHSRQDV
jgi:hypothetical protein